MTTERSLSHALSHLQGLITQYLRRPMDHTASRDLFGKIRELAAMAIRCLRAGELVPVVDEPLIERLTRDGAPVGLADDFKACMDELKLLLVELRK